MCDPALHRSSLDVCSSGVSCASTHTDLAPAPTRPSYFEASLTCPKHVRLYLCATSPSHPRGSKSISGLQAATARLIVNRIDRWAYPRSFEHSRLVYTRIVKQNEIPIYTNRHINTKQTDLNTHCKGYCKT